MERALITEYEATLSEIAERLSPETIDIAVELASVPERIRGYGPVKARHVAEAKERREGLLGQLRDPASRPKSRVSIPVRVAA